MKHAALPSRILSSAWLLLSLLCLAWGSSLAQTSDLSAAQLMAGVKAARPLGGVYTRIRIEHDAGGGAEPVILQAQLKRRDHPGGGSDHLYQILFPAERKGEGLLLHINGTHVTGSIRDGSGIRPLTGKDRSQPLFGTTLMIEDLIAEFLNWPGPEALGTEEIDRVPCRRIRLQRPSGSASALRQVELWVDEKRYVTQRIDAWTGRGDAPDRRVETDKVVRGANDYFIPASFTVRDLHSSAATRVEGVRSVSDVSYTDADFEPAALGEVSGPPRS
ncbi:MAG: outer membrane lipoprotein-sorting protein [Verrucomicrobiales bacterium]|nr:outer membrane lipoprotein-sorting protein [Verrucomicrobiales bacterium]